MSINESRFNIGMNDSNGSIDESHSRSFESSVSDLRAGIDLGKFGSMSVRSSIIARV